MKNTIIITLSALATVVIYTSGLEARTLRTGYSSMKVQDDYCPPPSDDQSDDQDSSDQSADSSDDCQVTDDSQRDNRGTDQRQDYRRSPPPYGYGQRDYSRYPQYPDYSRYRTSYGQGDDGSDRISHVDVDTDLPFIDFNADISVNTDDSGNIQSVYLSGNIPGVGTQTLSISQFINVGIRSNGLTIRAEAGFSPSRGGAVDVDAVLCSGGSGHSRFYLGSSGGTWRLSGGAQITLKAKTSFGRFGGCFYSVTAN